MTTARTTRTGRAIGLVALMGLTLAVLAVLQYRWIGGVSQSEKTRLRVSLENAVQQFRTEFNAELRRLCLAFELGPQALAGRRWDLFIERYDEWSGDERHARLIENVYLIVQQADGTKSASRLDAPAGQWVPAQFPLELDALRRLMDRRLPGRLPPAAAARVSPWRILAENLVLVQPLIVPEQGSGSTEIAGYLALELNRPYFQEVFLPEMMRRYFSGRSETDFDVAVVAGREHRKVISAPDAGSIDRLLSAPDLRSRVLWDRADLTQALAGVPPQRLDAPGGGEQPPPPLVPAGRRLRRVPVLFANEANDWEIVARFRGGSLEEIVSKSRARTLAVSFGVLLLLGVGMTLIILGARRSHQLADLQMRFVAGVSHDLRTPLAVICSAADNLADGVVGESGQRVKEYGALIRSEGRKLSAMVEQILQYASLQSASRKKPELRPCAARDVVAAVLADEKPLIDSLGVEIQVDIPAELPAVLCDRASLRQALRNLVSNSLKHAASGRWLCIRAGRAPEAKGGEISISVEDRGPGIDPEDLPRIFDPFYRGRNASASGVPGSGLGLSVVQESVSAMGGRVTVQSVPGKGSTFALILPSADGTESRD